MRKYWIWIIIALGICGVLWFALKRDGEKKKSFVFELPRRKQIYPPEEEQSLQELLDGMERSIEMLGDKMQKEPEQKWWLMVNLHECINRLTDEDEPFKSTQSVFPLKDFITPRRGRMGHLPVRNEIITVPDAEPNMVREKMEEVTSLEVKVRRLICRLNLLTWSMAIRSYMTDASIEHLKGRLASIDPNQL